MAFHESYLNLLTQLPPSLIKAGWNRLTTRKKNPLSESEASSISPIIEAFLKHEVDRYQRQKKSRYNPTLYKDLSVSLDPKDHAIVVAPLACSAINLEDYNLDMKCSASQKVTSSEEEINTRVKEATDALRQEFIKSTEETLKIIKQQKVIDCMKIKTDMANWNTKLFEHTLKKYIREGTIYYLIHELEEKDGKLYPDISKKN